MALFDMKMDILQGQISHVSSGFETFGRADRGTGVSHTNTWTFRVDNKPVSFKTKQNLSFSDGDLVTAVGGERNGTFHVTCLRNDTTGAVFEPTATVAYIIGGLMILLGIITLVIIIGFIFIALGAFFLWAGYKGSQAVTILRNTPPAKNKPL